MDAGDAFAEPASLSLADTHPRVWLHGAMSAPFELHRSVPQVDPLSPLLFGSSLTTCCQCASSRRRPLWRALTSRHGERPPPLRRLRASRKQTTPCCSWRCSWTVISFGGGRATVMGYDRRRVPRVGRPRVRQDQVMLVPPTASGAAAVVPPLAAIVDSEQHRRVRHARVRVPRCAATSALNLCRRRFAAASSRRVSTLAVSRLCRTAPTASRACPRRALPRAAAPRVRRGRRRCRSNCPARCSTRRQATPSLRPSGAYCSHRTCRRAATTRRRSRRCATLGPPSPSPVQRARPCLQTLAVDFHSAPPRRCTAHSIRVTTTRRTVRLT